MFQVPLIVVGLFPPLAFCLAGILEYRSQESLPTRLYRLIPISMGLAAFVLALGAAIDFAGFLRVTPHSSVVLSLVMQAVSCIIACSGRFIKYSRHLSAFLVAGGGLVLAVIWMFDYDVVLH